MVACLYSAGRSIMTPPPELSLALYPALSLAVDR